jgi:hypothetical protein
MTNGAAVSGIVRLGSAAPHWEVSAVGDYDGDGRCDISWRSADDGGRLLWCMDGPTVRQLLPLAPPAALNLRFVGPR